MRLNFGDRKGHCSALSVEHFEDGDKSSTEKKFIKVRTLSCKTAKLERFNKNTDTHYEGKSAFFMVFPQTPTHLFLHDSAVSSGQAEASETVATSDDTCLIFPFSHL